MACKLPADSPTRNKAPDARSQGRAPGALDSWGIRVATDKQLVKQAGRGDERAFELLVLKYQQRIFALINRYVRDPDEVQDVAQETFIKAWNALPRFRGESAFYTWLYRIAVNTAKNHLVSKGRRPPGSDVDASEAEQYPGADQLRDIGTPESQALSEELRTVIGQTIEGLPEELRRAVTLREFEGLSYEDIAAIMECPVGTVRSRIFRAREAIDQAMKPLLSNQ